MSMTGIIPSRREEPRIPKHHSKESNHVEEHYYPWRREWSVHCSFTLGILSMTRWKERPAPTHLADAHVAVA